MFFQSRFTLKGDTAIFFVHRPQSAVHRLNPKKRWTAVGGLWTLCSLFEQNALTGIVFATFEFEKMDYQL